MNARFPLLMNQRSDETFVWSSPVSSSRPVVICEDPSALIQSGCPSEPQQSVHMLCTYQCRQMVKSEFLDAFSKAEKQAHDYHSKLEEVNAILLKTETDKKQFQDQLLHVVQELSASKGREQVLQEKLLKEASDSHDRLKKQIESHSKLQLTLESERKLRIEAESVAASAKEEICLLGRKCCNLSESLERGKKHFQIELLHIQHESKLSVSHLTADLEKMEMRAKCSANECEQLKETMLDQKMKLNECLQQNMELENRLRNLNYQEVTPKENNILLKNMQEELRSYEFEVREARKLKASHDNIELLKEKLLEEQRSRGRVELELSRLQGFELRMKLLEDELSSWKLAVKGIPDISHGHDLARKISALQKEIFVNMRKVTEANARLKEMKVALDNAQFSRQSIAAEASLAKKSAEALTLEARRLELMLSTIAEERDSLKNTVFELQTQKNDNCVRDQTDGTIIEALKSSLEKKEICIKELQSSLLAQKEANKHQHDELLVLNGKFNGEQRRVKSLEREGDRLRSEISLLQSKIGLFIHNVNSTPTSAAS